MEKLISGESPFIRNIRVHGEGTGPIKTRVSEALPEAKAAEAVEFRWKRKRTRKRLHVMEAVAGSGCQKKL